MTGVSDKEIDLVGISWIFANSPDAQGAVPFTASIDIDVSYSGDLLEASDIASAQLTWSDGSKQLPWDIDFSDHDNWLSIFPAQLLYGTQTFHADSSNAIPSGEYTFTVELNNGFSDSVTYFIPQPGVLTSSSSKTLYTEDYTGTITADHQQLIKRATNLAGAFSNNQVHLEFSSDDEQFYSFFVLLYDDNTNRIGRSAKGRSILSETIADFVNSGTSLYNDGSLNELTLDEADIQFESSHSMSDIQAARVLLTDGAVYAGDSETYTSYSVSDYLIFLK